MRSVALILLLFNFFPALQENAFGQLVNREFPVQIYQDDFESDKGDWKMISNADNLFIIQDGNYLLNRKNPNSSYSIFPVWKNTRTAFEILCGLRFDTGNEPDAAAGIIFMAQEDGSGAFVLEINGQKQYRLKQLVGVNFRILTGNPKQGGWEKSENLLGSGLLNQIQVKSTERNYDVYFNRKYIFSFSELAYKSGNMGISIGPSTQARVDYYTVNGLEDDRQKSLDAGLDYMSTNALKSEILQLRSENKMLRDSLQLLKKEISKKPAKHNR